MALPSELFRTRSASEVPINWLVRQEKPIGDNRLHALAYGYAASMQANGVRKEEHIIGQGESFPSPFKEALVAFEERFGIKRPNYNTAIFKRYEPGEPSGAFIFHPDPRRFLGRGKRFRSYLFIF